MTAVSNDPTDPLDILTQSDSLLFCFEVLILSSLFDTLMSESQVLRIYYTLTLL